MPVKVIMGLQWGDEGKGKVVDQMVNDWADVVVRYQGGNNAGHTIYDEQNNKYVLHALPSGVLKECCLNIITKGCVIEPLKLYSELRSFPNAAVKISDQCPLVLPHHIMSDILKYQSKIGTTAKGIGPAYAEYIARDNFTTFDLTFNFEILKKEIGFRLTQLYNESSYEKFETVFQHYLLSNHFDTVNEDSSISFLDKMNRFVDEYVRQIELVNNYLLHEEMIINSDELIQNLYSQQKNIILEGAQGWGLDIWGRSYPNVTSSCPNIGGALISTNLNHKQIDEVIGVVKIYKSKVGEGNHSTEYHLHDNISAFIDDARDALGEFGATTGRPRRLGWLNMDEIKQACQTNGIDHIVITRVDSIHELKTPRNSFYVLHENEYLAYALWEDLKNFEDENEFLNQEELSFFISDFKRITNVPKVSLSFGPKRNQIKWNKD